MSTDRRTSRAVRISLALTGAAFILLATGCRPASTQQAGSPATPQPKTPLRVLVVDDEPLGAAIARQWQSRTESEIEVQHATSKQIDEARRLPADVVVFPSPLLGQLTEQSLIGPLPAGALKGQEFDERGLLDQVRLSEIRWGHKAAVVPLGSPQFLFVYRADMLKHLQVAPPQTWADYQAIVEKLRDPAALGDLSLKDVKAWQPAVEPLAAPWSGRLLLARAAAYVTHRDQVAALFQPDTMAPLIDTPPFVRALEELVAANSDTSQRRTPAQVVEQVALGNAAIGIGFPEAAAPGRSKDNGGSESNFAFTPLPGSNDTFNFAVGEWERRRGDEELRASLLGIPGRQAAISSSARQSEAAVSFLIWLSSSQISSRTSPSSTATAPFRRSQLNETGRWLGLPPEAAKSCAAALEQSLSSKRSVIAPRIPGQERYLAALDDAVESSISNKQSPAEALKDAAEQWQKITESLGREKQQLAYRRSLNVADWP